ncbi:hypothetical protein [Streptomyces niveus]
MEKIKGTGRVTVFQLLHDWPDSYCILGYTTTGHFGDTAVLGIIPVEGNPFEPGDLYGVAGRHDAGRFYGGSHDHARGAWLACLGFSARLTPKPETINIPEVGWELDMARKVNLDPGKSDSLYGNRAVIAGRLSLPEPLMSQARALLPEPAPARYGPIGRVG